MKILTKQLLVFAILLAIYTLVFRIGLSFFIGRSAWVLLGISAVAYGTIIAFTAWFLGKSDSQENPFFDLGLRFHVTTFLIWAGVSVGWFYLGNPHEYEHIEDILHPLLIWSVFLVLHTVAFLVTRRNTIRGIHRDDIF